MKKLPIGIQTFSKLIHDNYVYVDKTREIFNLIQNGQYFFISRPRRFGKSLLVSTLSEIFSGNQALFQGLYIYDKIDWNPHPVIHIDLSGISYENADMFKQSLSSFLERIARNAGFELSEEFLKDRFSEVIRKLYETTGTGVVVLIDEYDKPIIDHIDNIEIAYRNREILKDFYGVLKYSDQYLRFVFLTGVSKFSKVSIFSGLNNLEDITLGSRFASITGITQEDLTTYFAEHLSKLQNQEDRSVKDLVEQIRFWYNGYSWDGVTSVYNPFSLLNLFATMEYSNYWFASGTPTFLIKKIREQQIDITALERQQFGGQSFDSYDLEHMELYPLLFQTGYLTIKEMKTSRRGSKSYLLSYPNFEVQESLLTYLLADFTSESVPTIQPLHEQMFEYLNSENIDACMQMIQSLFAGIPYPLHLREEAYYHSLFYMILKLLGADISAEVVTDKGRIDGVLECDERIYIIECKYGEAGRTMDTLTQHALRQIHEKKYYEPFLNSGKRILLLGIGFIDKVIGYQVEILKN